MKKDGEEQQCLAGPIGASPIDPAAFRISQNFIASAATAKILTTVPVRKPAKQEFIRVHPGDDYRISVGLLTYEAEREVYLVTPAMVGGVLGQYSFTVKSLPNP